MDVLLEEENTRWKQRAKQARLKDRDKTIKYLHMCANQRRKTNGIKIIVREYGSVACSSEHIIEDFHHFYQTLFTSCNTEGIDEYLISMVPKVTEKMNSF